MTEAKTKAPEQVVETPAVADGQKICHVLKNGAGKIAKGFSAVEEDGQAREQYYDKGENFIVAASIADALEDRGFVET